MLPLIRAAAQHQTVLYPDAYAGDMETALLKRPAEVQPLGISMEDVRAAALGHMRGHVFEGCQQEGEELFIRHTVILDFLSIG